MNLPEIRQKIDALDEQLLALLNQRADLVHEVGLVKKRDGSAIYVPEREEQLLRSLAEKNHGRLPEKSIRAIYREIMSASFALEKGLSIAYLGPEATWTHQAARGKFGASVEYAAQPNIADVFNAVERDKADYGVVPIENSTEGAVNYTLDVFADSDLKICAEILLKIENNLIARIQRSEIRKVYSHPQVFGQCRNWLRVNLPNADYVEVSSTTRAAELAASEPNAAALAGKMAAEVYQLDVLEASIQDNPNNSTRFLVIGHTACVPTGFDKTSLMFNVQDKPGSLFAALAPFKELKLNLSKIESRPSKRKAWDYFFFVDVDGHNQDEALVTALEELHRHCSFVKILGSYPKISPTA
jgi:chorismate mutase/prephenate dehydratase